jgi:hypothetical protein
MSEDRTNQDCNELEYNILQLLYNDSHAFGEFKDKSMDDHIEISLYTLKIPHLKKFKCITMSGKSKYDCLNNIFLFLKKEIPNNKYINYHVQWTRKEYNGDCARKEYHSYFYVRNIQELLENFYSGIDVNDHDYCVQKIEMVAES